VIEGGLSQILALLVFLVTAHYIEPSAFGVLAAAMLTVELFRQVVVEGLVTAVNTQLNPTSQDYNACFFLMLGISILCAAGLFLSSNLIGSIVPVEHLSQALPPVCLLVLVLGLSRTHEAYLSRNLEFRLLAIRSVVSIVIGGGVGISMAVHGFGLWALICQQLTTALISLLALWTACKWRPTFAVTGQAFKRILGYAKHVSATGVTNFANSQADIAFTAYYLGPTNTGFYNAAKRIGYAINQIIASSLNRVVLPTLARIQADKERSGRVFIQAVSLTCTVTAPAYAGLSALAPDAIQLAMGAKWATTATLLSIISLNFFLTTVGQYNQTVMLVRGKPHWQTILTTVYAASNIVLFLGFVKFGVLAIAAAFTFRGVLFFPVSVGLALRLVDVKWSAYASALLPAVSCALLMGAVVAGMRAFVLTDIPAVARVAILIPFGGVIYVGLLWLVRKESVTEIVRLAQQMLKR
jgi:O-antigen/teichoic acid export membrane protein